jgi:hypothetical protein
MKAWHRRPRPTATSAIEQPLGHGSSSGIGKRARASGQRSRFVSEAAFAVGRGSALPRMETRSGLSDGVSPAGGRPTGSSAGTGRRDSRRRRTVDAVDARTEAVIEHLGWKDAPARGALTALETSAAAAVLHDAWVRGDIPGFPDSDHELALAQRHVLRMAEIEAEARRCRLEGSHDDRCGARSQRREQR